ncbi:MAG: glycosyltransferase [Bacteroidota bacterium]
MITVVLPAFNEEKNLPPLIDRIGAALSCLDSPFRILVVDDGSTDGTADAARSAALSLPVELIRHPRNLGLGAAMRTGFASARSGGGSVVTMDADNSHDPILIPRMIRLLEEGHDVVIASRFRTGGREIGVPPHRRVLSHAAGGMMRILVRYPGVRDYSCGYRAYGAGVLSRLAERFGENFVREQGFACMFEILLKLKAVGARATEVPLVLRYDLKRGASKMRVGRTMLRYTALLSSGGGRVVPAGRSTGS